MAAGGQGALWRWQRARTEVQELHSRPIEFGEMHGWTADDHCAALACYIRSARLTAQPMAAEQEMDSLLRDRDSARKFFETRFSAEKLVTEPGLLTSYFEPVLKGSRQRSRAFSIPVYSRPGILKPLPDGHPLTGQGFTAGREAAGEFFPFATRGEIEEGSLEGLGLEILYLADPLEAFVMHVQGCGFVELEDGPPVRLTFDGKNGHPYTSIAKLLVERGALSKEQADLDGMLGWLRSRHDMQRYLNQNKSYIFFKELAASVCAPKGSCGASLSPGRSLAADPLYHAPGTPIWVESPELVYEGKALTRLLIVQDTGSAIRGPQRGDIFAGMGADARNVAGKIRHRGEFIVLKPRR